MDSFDFLSVDFCAKHLTYTFLSIRTKTKGFSNDIIRGLSLNLNHEAVRINAASSRLIHDRHTANNVFHAASS